MSQGRQQGSIRSGDWASVDQSCCLLKTPMCEIVAVWFTQLNGPWNVWYLLLPIHHWASSEAPVITPGPLSNLPCKLHSPNGSPMHPLPFYGHIFPFGTPELDKDDIVIRCSGCWQLCPGRLWREHYLEGSSLNSGCAGWAKLATGCTSLSPAGTVREKSLDFSHAPNLEGRVFVYAPCGAAQDFARLEPVNGIGTINTQNINLSNWCSDTLGIRAWAAPPPPHTQRSWGIFPGCIMPNYISQKQFMMHGTISAET